MRLRTWSPRRLSTRRTRSNPCAGDELHHVVMDAVLLADAEDGHDVGVVQPGGRLRLAKKPLQARGRGHPGRRQDLQRHVPAERLLLRLVDDAHAAAADLPQDAEIAQPLQRRPAKAGRRGRWPCATRPCPGAGPPSATAWETGRGSARPIADGARRSRRSTPLSPCRRRSRNSSANCSTGSRSTVGVIRAALSRTTSTRHGATPARQAGRPSTAPGRGYSVCWRPPR